MSTSNDYNYQIYKLSSDFYNNYPQSQYKEILAKDGRPYSCIVFELIDGCFVSVPYRTEIKHSYAYLFKNSSRSRRNKSGLDYSKMVIITNFSYIDSGHAIIDQDEYNETVQNIEKIQKEAFEFLDEYISHIKGEKLLHQSEFNRRYRYSPLKYFHNELRI